MMAASSAPDTPTADDINGGGLRPAATSVSLQPGWLLYPFHRQRLRACRVHMGSRNLLYILVFRASSRVQMIPSERDIL
jgi:hypothetical protein